MRALGMGDSFFSSTVEWRKAVASRKETLSAMPIGLTVLDGVATLREVKSWCRRYEQSLDLMVKRRRLWGSCLVDMSVKDGWE